MFRKVGDAIQLIDARDETSRQNGGPEQDDIDTSVGVIPALGIDEEPTEQNTVTFEFIKDQTGLGRNKLTELSDKLRDGQIIGRVRSKVTSPYGFFRYRWA